MTQVIIISSFMIHNDDGAIDNHDRKIKKFLTLIMLTAPKYSKEKYLKKNFFFTKKKVAETEIHSYDVRTAITNKTHTPSYSHVCSLRTYTQIF